MGHGDRRREGEPSRPGRPERPNNVYVGWEGARHKWKLQDYGHTLRVKSGSVLRSPRLTFVQSGKVDMAVHTPGNMSRGSKVGTKESTQRAASTAKEPDGAPT